MFGTQNSWGAKIKARLKYITHTRPLDRDRTFPTRHMAQYDQYHTETRESMPPNLDEELLVGSSSPEAVKKFTACLCVNMYNNLRNSAWTLPDVETTAEHKHVMISPKRSTRFEFFFVIGD